MNRLTAPAVLGVVLSLSLLAAAPAEARRGGSFGSRGMRTYSMPQTTRTAPQAIAPVQRSMTPQAPGGQRAAVPANSAALGAQPRGRGLFGGMGGGLLAGLAAGGLLGWMMGNGFGGFNAGLMQSLMQAALIGLGIFLLMGLFRRRQAPQPAGFAREAGFGAGAPVGFQGLQGLQGQGGAGREPFAPAGFDITLTQADRDAFERLLGEVQDAFGREDYAALRERTTPEIMSYLSEELSQNAVQGRRNEVSGTRLLQADVGEAWREDGDEYATAALRYESVDVMRDRASGRVVSGDPSPSETTELWTFARRAGGPWKLSAIQDA